ncbi:MAG: ATP-binding protein [Clostridia bacterium]|nr:ATP-binding protein [Clostridia bacterium]
MREDLLREAELELQETQRRNEETALRRRQEVMNRSPEIASLLAQREDLIHGTMRGILQREAAPEDLPERMEQVSQNIRKRLKNLGLPEDYLAPVYDCPLCRDTGYVGDVVRERCACVRRRYQARLRKAIGLPERGEETFETYDETLFADTPLPDVGLTERQAMAVIRDGCEKWANNYPAQIPRDLVLSGKSGLGKTFLLHAMANRLIQRGYNVLLISAYQFLETARRAYFDNEAQAEDLTGAEVLMLDDLGSEPMMQNVTIEQLFNLINERQRRNLATVISTNLSQEELRIRYTERIASRLTDRRNALFLPLRGRDVRNGRQG